jgi:hypothetical protein
MTRREQMTAGQRRYEQSPKGKAAKKRYNDKRIFLARTRCVGVAATAEQARAINAHIQRRRREFIATAKHCGTF